MQCEINKNACPLVFLVFLSKVDYFHMKNYFDRWLQQ